MFEVISQLDKAVLSCDFFECELHEKIERRKR